MEKPALLIVDDKWDNILVLSAVIEEYLPQFEIIAASNGKQGIELAGDRNLDGALIDVQIPGMDGIEICRRLKNNESTAYIPIILITAHDVTSELKARGLEAGADDFIQRPIDSTELVARIRVMVRIKKAEDALRRQAHEAIAESQERYKSLFRNSCMVMLIIDPGDGTIVDANPKACRFYGYSKNVLIGMPIAEINILPLGEVLGKMKNAIGHMGGRFDFQHRLANGDVRDVEVFTGPIEVEGQTLVYSIVHDITARKEAEEALVKAEQEKDLILSSMLDRLIHLDGNLKVQWANRAVCEELGVTHGEVAGNFCYSLWPHRTSPCEGCPAIESFKTARMEESEVVCSDGKVLFVRAYPVLDTGGAVLSVVSLAREITERKRSEEQLLRLSIAIEHVSDAIVITNVRGKIEYINPAFEKITGYSREEVLGEHPRTLSWLRTLYTTLAWDRPCNGRISDKRRDGTPYEIEVAVSPILDASGSVVNYISVGRDVTQEMRLQAQLRQTQKMEAIGMLAGGIAHDFNNILSPVIGYTEMAMDELSEGTRLRKDLTQVLKAAQRARELVKQILHFSRQGEQERRPLRIVSIVSEALKLLRASLPSTIEIRQNVSCFDGMVMADPVQMHQVLMNLCTNAAHAMRERGGVLEIGLHEENVDGGTEAHHDLRPGPYLKLMVRDTGHGIEAELMERIFNPYFTTKKPGEGTGLGLAVVLGIVRNHSGTIGVRSDVGKGTTFDVFLPKVTSDAVQEAEVISRPLRGKERILFVDDEHMIVDSGERVLRSLGYEVVATSNPLGALETFRGNPQFFDLIITDQTMPGITGVDLAREVMRIRPDIPVILCTGFSQTVTREQAESMGIREFVMKPFSKNQISEIIRKVIDDNDSSMI